MKLPKTIGGLMFVVAIIGLVLGIMIDVAPYLPLIFVATLFFLPQIIFIVLCLYLATRETTP